MMSLSRRAAAAAAGILHLLKSYFEQKSAQKRSDEGAAKEQNKATERRYTHEKSHQSHLSVSIITATLQISTHKS